MTLDGQKMCRGQRNAVSLLLCIGLGGAGLGLLAACGTAPTARFDAASATPEATTPRVQRHLQLASAYFEQGQDAVALQEVQQVLRIDARDAEAYSLQGLIYQHQQSPALADASFRQALQLLDGQPQANAVLGAVQHNYGWFLCQQQRWDAAQQTLQSALSQPAYAGAFKTWAVLGECQWRAGQPQAAGESWRQALRLNPADAWVQTRLAALDASAHVAPALPASASQSE